MKDLHLTDDATLDAVLRSMDPASPDLTDVQRARGEELLTSLTTQPESITPPTPIRRARMARWLVPAAAASVLVVGSLFVPNPTVTPPAFADWTPKPTPVAEPLLSKSAENCRNAWARSENPDDPQSPIIKPETARVVLAEQRGSHIFVAMVTDTGADAQCMANDNGSVHSLSSGAPTDEYSHPTVAPTEITGGSVGYSLEGTEGYAYVQGEAGDQVREVTIRWGDQTVNATVSDGHYAAWWPVTTDDLPLGGTIDVVLDVTLADGTVLKDVDTDLTRELGPKPGPTEVGRIAIGGGAGDGEFFEMVEGLAGERVTAVTVHIGGDDHVAEVKNGSFSATWSVDELPEQEMPQPTFTLTLDDGTVLERVDAVS